MTSRSTDFVVLSVVEQRILEALATYRLMTVELLRLAGAGRDVKHLRGALAKLARQGLIVSRDGGFTPGKGRNPGLHMLTPKGAAALALLNPDAPPAQAARAMTAGVQHVPHWLGVVVCHMALRGWASTAGVSVDWVKTEFERAEGLKRATRLEGAQGPYIPDALAQITMPDGRPRFLVLEYYRNSLQHALSKLPGVGDASATMLVETHFKSKIRARYAIVFETVELRDRALARWPERHGHQWKSCFVKAASELDDFNSGWVKPSGETVSLFSIE